MGDALVALAAAGLDAEYIGEVNAAGEFLIALLHLMARPTERDRFPELEGASKIII
jgi:hypothetical protein